MNKIKQNILKIPIIGSCAKLVFGKNKSIDKPEFNNSSDYWERRYIKGGSSGAGSYNRLAEFKARVINDFVEKQNIKSVIEFGCGDGNQLQYFNFSEYLGFDVSQRAVELCSVHQNAKRKFRLMKEYVNEKADLVMSLDVIYHLVEDEVFEQYLKKLFCASKRFVIIYSSNWDENILYADGKQSHVRHRKFTDWVEKNEQNHRLIQHIPNQHPFDGQDYENTSFADFYIFEKI